MARAFPPGFLFGTATSATQIEGGEVDSDWLRFSREPGQVHAGDTPAKACEHWERWFEDVQLQAELGMTAHRMSIEWARVEPSPGRFDHDALDRYREELGVLVGHGITPMLTLHHFTLPPWMADDEGLCSPRLPERMERYTSVVADALGDLCRLWCTVNEPNVVATMGYLFGLWPPAQSGRLDRALVAQQRLLEAHVRCYRVLKDKLGDAASVGCAHHLRIFEPKRKDKRRDRLISGAMDGYFNNRFAGAIADGRRLRGVDDVLDRVTGFDAREAQGTQDYWGINYYSRDIISLFSRTVPDEAETSDLGWEIYPEGLLRVLRRWHDRQPLPVFITENGIATNDDAQRSRFLVAHLRALLDAVDEGVDVRGYFHWSLLDNFEWHEGYAPRFGLCEVDYETQARRPRDSARLYARIASDHALDRAIVDDVLSGGRAA
jgi:beta-glucosidase